MVNYMPVQSRKHNIVVLRFLSLLSEFCIFHWLCSAMLFLVACNPAIPVIPTPSSLATEIRLPTPLVRSSLVPTLSPASSPTPTDRLGVSPDKLMGVRIKLWHSWNGKDSETLASLAQEFNRTNPWGIVLEPLSHRDLDQIASHFESGLDVAEMPDILTAYPYQMLEWDEEYGLVDLEDYVQDPKSFRACGTRALRGISALLCRQKGLLRF